MQKSRVENLVSKIILILLIFWGAGSFFIFPAPPVAQWSALVVSLIATYLAIAGSSEYFVLLTIVFSSSYFLYGVLFTYSPSLWLIMVGQVVFLAPTFWILGRKLVSNKTNFTLILLLFLLSMLEIYLTLSFWLINPLTRSVVMVLPAYVFYGYLSAKAEDGFIAKKFYSYIYVAVAILIVLSLTVSWGR